MILAAVVKKGLSEEVTSEQDLKDEKEQATGQEVVESTQRWGNSKCKDPGAGFNFCLRASKEADVAGMEIQTD